jgi:hypothetical protein
MKLTNEEADLFYDLMWSLQCFVNDKLNIVPEATKLHQYIDLPKEEKYLIREKIFEQPNLIDEYVEKNPDKLEEKKLSMVKDWKKFIKGGFYIERYLKNHAILVDDIDVYGVCGLYEGFDEMIHKSRLPFHINTVLLPFQGRIVYDGFMTSYNVFFGSGIKSSLKESYMKAKQNGRIITLFDDETYDEPTKIEAQENVWSKELDQLASIAKKLKGGGSQPMINSPIFSLIRSSIDLANKAANNHEDADALYQELRKINRAANKIETILSRMD